MKLEIWITVTACCAVYAAMVWVVAIG